MNGLLNRTRIIIIRCRLLLPAGITAWFLAASGLLFVGDVYAAGSADIVISDTGLASTATYDASGTPASVPDPVKAAATQYVVPDAVPMFVKIVGENAPAAEPLNVTAAPPPAPAAAEVHPPVSAVQSKGSPAVVDKQFCNKNVKTTVLFDANKAELKARYHKKLNEMGALLKKYPDSKVTISGHTAAVGSKGTSFEFSQVRADNLKNYIINKFGIDSSRIITKGFGSGKPVATNKTSAGRSKNRRLDVIFSCE